MGRHDRKTKGEPMKAQITMFIVIGILVIVAFGITIYVGSRMGERIEVKESQQRMEQLGIQPIQDYITTCLTLAATEGLSLIGRQGGTIYQSQGGLTPDYREREGERYVKYTDQQLGILDVSFLIIPPEGNVNELFFSEPPEYPFPGFPYPPGENKPLFTGYYGVNKLPPLYKISADTKQQVEGSIQENLETFIAKKTVNCASWKTFEDRGYTITPGQAIASLLFANQTEQFRGEQHITIELLWPIEITTPGGDKTILKDFATKLPVRLATIYYTTKQLVDGDVTDISFMPRSVGTFDVTILPYGQDSFIIAKDTQSIIANKPFEFWIPRKNRRPALWNIDTEPIQAVTFHVTSEGRGAQVKIIDNFLSIEDPCQDPDVQNPYLIQLNASDPDEGNVTYAVHIPSAAGNEIPADAVNFAQFSITVSAKDRSSHPNEWFDSQEIPLKVVLCPVR
jgi:hypothetical protein